jgi:hypothetical protein
LNRIVVVINTPSHNVTLVIALLSGGGGGGSNTRDSRKISFYCLPSAGNGMDEMHTNVGGMGH